MIDDCATTHSDGDKTRISIKSRHDDDVDDDDHDDDDEHRVMATEMIGRAWSG